jgi:hypothetical protein
VLCAKFTELTLISRKLYECAAGNFAQRRMRFDESSRRFSLQERSLVSLPRFIFNTATWNDGFGLGRSLRS